MLPKQLKVKNYTSYVDETISFDSFPNLFCVIGENGAGKSSIIDIITTALFYRARGTDSRGSGMDQLINLNADQFIIEFDFEMNNIDYKIIRRKKRDGAHELEFYINGQSQTEKIGETQVKINDVLKMDYDTFLDTVCIGQGQSGRFMKKKSNERKEVFVQVLGLDKFEVLEKYVKELKKDTASKIEILETTLNHLNSEISLKGQYQNEISSNDLKIEDLKLIITNKEQELENILIEKAQYDQVKQQRDHIINQRNNLKNKIETIKNSLITGKIKKEELGTKILNKDSINSDIKELKSDLANQQTKYTELNSEQSSLSTMNNLYNVKAKQIKEKYEKLLNYNEANCNDCGQKISLDYKEKYLKDLMTEGKKYLSDINNNKTKIDKLKQEINETHASIINIQKKIQLLESKSTEIVQAETNLISINTKLMELESSLLEYEIEYKENLKISVNNIEEKTFNDSILRNEISNLRNELRNFESKVTLASRKIQEIEVAEEKIEKSSGELEELKILLSDYESLVIAYGKSGIQADIIGNALPEIEDEINKLLMILCNGKVNVEFRTQKEKKKKSKTKSIASIETLDIIINDELGSRTYETYSGGEQFRVDFACHVGLAKFLAKRAGATIDFFMVDEGLGSQDENAKEQFVTSVKQLTKIFKQVMVITHIDTMKEAFDAKVLVSKDPINGSKVNLL